MAVIQRSGFDRSAAVENGLIYERNGQLHGNKVGVVNEAVYKEISSRGKGEKEALATAVDLIPVVQIKIRRQRTCHLDCF